MERGIMNRREMQNNSREQDLENHHINEFYTCSSYSQESRLESMEMTYSKQAFQSKIRKDNTNKWIFPKFLTWTIQKYILFLVTKVSWKVSWGRYNQEEFKSKWMHLFQVFFQAPMGKGGKNIQWRINSLFHKCWWEQRQLHVKEWN